MINEELARRNKENYSFYDYVPGSATSDYNKQVEEATKKIEEAKKEVSEEGRERLEKLLNSYKVNLENWINKSNANGANHVSSMICGPANYNMNKHNKFIAKEEKLMSEYNDIINIEDKIWSIVNGDKIIKSSDPEALNKLKEKLRLAEEEHQGYKDYNINARKEKKETLSSYVLQNSNGRIKAIKDRIAHLERLAAKAEAIPVEERTTETNGIKVIDNIEANRLQIIFPGKPDANTRTELKKHGFRWCPTNSAWQRYRGLEATRIANKIVSEIEKRED